MALRAATARRMGTLPWGAAQCRGLATQSLPDMPYDYGALQVLPEGQRPACSSLARQA